MVTGTSQALRKLTTRVSPTRRQAAARHGGRTQRLAEVGVVKTVGGRDLVRPTVSLIDVPIIWSRCLGTTFQVTGSA